MRYAVALAAVAGAALLVAALRPWLGDNVFFPFLAAVVLSAWYGGFGPGAVAAVAGALAVNFLWIEPYLRFALPGADDAVRTAAFLALALAVSWASGALVRALEASEAGRRALAAANLRLREQQAELELANEQLQEQQTELELGNQQLQEQQVELEQQQEEMRTLAEELERQLEEAHALRMEMEEQVACEAILRGDLEGANAGLQVAGREAEAARARLERILETMAEGVVLVDAGGRITFANAAAAAILGLPREAAVGVRYDDPRFAPARPGGAAMAPDEAPAARVLRTGLPVHGDEVTLGMEGRRKVLRVNAAPLKDAAGAVTGVVVSFDDVTADRAAEEALRESEARFRAMADTAPVLVWTSGTDALCDFFNQPWLDFTGRTLARELGNGWTEGVHPDDYTRCVTTYLSAFEERRAFRMEYRLRRADGEYRWVLDTGVPRFTPDGGFAGYIGSCIDITERREAEEQQRFLAEAGTLLASSLDYEETLRRVCRLAVPVLGDFCVVDLLDDAGRAHRVEAAHADPALEPLVRELRRFPVDPASSNTVAEVLRTGLPRVVNELTDAHLEAALVDAGHRDVVRRLGVTAYMAVPLVAAGRVLGSILVCVTDSGRRYDAAELVRAEELARRAAFAIDNARLYERAVQANRAKSDFLAVMSHELRTPLNAIIGYTDLFLFGVPAPLPEPMRPQMERVQAAARHLLELIDEILTFARLEAGQEEVRLEPVDAKALAQDAAALAEPLALERGIGFEVRLPDGALGMETDARKARQVLVNLLGNAIKFTDEGRAALEVAPDGDAVRFTVSDTGVGITPEQMEHIFEPFWQADQGLVRAHGGSGLGLSVARQLARLLGGDVTAESRPGEGSVFTLRLPARAGAAPARPS